jgi:hypothetical protein
MISAFALPNEIEPGELGAPLAVCSVHLTKLLPDGADRVREGQGKIIVGRPLGLPIAVSCIGDGLSLAVTEGVEDALAYADIGIGAWAAGAAFYMPTLAAHIPDYVTSLTIEKHIDVSERAQQAVERAVAQLQTLIHQRPLREGERPIKINIRKASA